MRERYEIPPSLIRKIDAYRRDLAAQTGKLVTRQTAVVKILSDALAGVEPNGLPEYQVLVARVERLETACKRLVASERERSKS